MKIFKPIFKSITSFIVFLKSTFDLRDYFVFGGILSIAAGVWLIYMPAALIVFGCMFFWLGVRRIK